ncbi:50S ribosomal protein L5 [Candidatus Woesearchaeota archaeon]|nr:50S ribosomal protein L5 [Candidatus Woesearchaeota archaeon]MCF7901350.1 50S ribosomal protein L5 [Candidatus Woesearchaeota archaeon]MCF8013350.1 50S ribosomal protein L5 [Candidatus Woesearchaeota archaeon]
MTNPMKEIRIEKVTLNIGAGKDQKVLEKGIKLIKNITGKSPIKTITNKRIQGWGLRAGLAIGTKLTLRNEEAVNIIPRLLVAKDNTLKKSSFDNNGNVSFGIPEYIDIEGAKYDTEIGMMGLQATITLKRPGFRIKNRRLNTKKIPSKHRINQEDAMNFMKEKFQTKVGDEE